MRHKATVPTKQTVDPDFVCCGCRDTVSNRLLAMLCRHGPEEPFDAMCYPCWHAVAMAALPMMQMQMMLTDALTKTE